MNNQELFSLIFIKESNSWRYLSQPKKAIAYYQHYSIDLKQGNRKSAGVSSLFSNADFKKRQNRIIHLTYDYSLPLFNMKTNSLLAIDIEYEKEEELFFEDILDKSIVVNDVHIPSYKSYLNKFNQVQMHLKKGNCYQLNLTNKIKIDLSQELTIEFLMKVIKGKQKKLGGLAHITNLPSLDMIFFSNSPECLFEIDKKTLVTRPIKGTADIGINNIESLWLNMLQNKKEASELDIITDLLRNDLTKITLTPSRVTERRKQLIVDELLHQYSQIEVDLPENIKFERIINTIFPGGSITGAPKKRVVELIDEIEDSKRGFYCGSTIFLDSANPRASINIRSFEIYKKDLKIFFGSGGGITLLSEPKSEYEEMLKKFKANFDLFFSYGQSKWSGKETNNFLQY